MPIFYHITDETNRDNKRKAGRVPSGGARDNHAGVSHRALQHGLPVRRQERAALSDYSRQADRRHVLYGEGE